MTSQAHPEETGATEGNHVVAPRCGRVNAPASVEELQGLLRGQAYLADRGLATSILLALSLRQPLLLEGEAGVGKTEVAKALSTAFDTELVRLQCYEGIDANQALYEWDFTRQLIYARTLQESGEDAADQIFSLRFLQERPLLKALKLGDRAVLLIDEIDRADDEFEAFLLEVLSDFQVTVPELGTIHAEQPPLVILTSNRTRELHDALKRRCLYHWIDYPDLQHEVDIVKARAPDVSEALSAKVAEAVSRLRAMDLVKKPGVSETITWVRALQVLNLDVLDEDAAEATLGSVLKDHEDLQSVRENLAEVLGGPR
jgi:MoxR-like ATPase